MAAPRRAGVRRLRRAAGRGGGGPSRQAAYDRIKEAIVDGVLQPMERITETQVGKRLGLSRTPVREAFRLLESEGLMVVVPQRGSFVSQPSIGDIVEIYQIRIPLECMAARLAALRLDDARLARLDALVAAQSRPSTRRPDESLAASAEFHEILIACVGNKRLSLLMKQLQAQVHRVRVLWPSTKPRLDDTWEEHARLLAALRSRDAAASERLMREHMERAQASTLGRLMPGPELTLTP
jgi:DNA-binding GntR family transcriptional regulator